jgi:hypothetical protein
MNNAAEDFSFAAELEKFPPLGLVMPIKKTRAKRQRKFLLEKRWSFTKTWKTIGTYAKIADARAKLVDMSPLPFMAFYRIRRTDVPL